MGARTCIPEDLPALIFGRDAIEAYRKRVADWKTTDDRRRGYDGKGGALNGRLPDGFRMHAPVRHERAVALLSKAFDRRVRRVEVIFHEDLPVPELALERDGRGFVFARFRDSNDEACSIQLSSAAEEDCLWLGMEKGTHVTVEGAEKCLARMHLTRRQVAALLPILDRFAKTGKLA